MSSKGLPPLKITDLQTICTAPNGVRLVIVKVLTSEPAPTAWGAPPSVSPIQAIKLAKELERYNLFFQKDPFAPEDVGYFPVLRQQTATPIAMGELFINEAEYVPLIKDRLIDFIRVHMSDIGGLLVEAIPAAGHGDPRWTIDLCSWPQAWEVTAADREFVAPLLARYA